MSSAPSGSPEAPPEFPPEVFVETSAHLAAFKAPALREKITSLLAKFDWRATSTFVQLEFGRNLLASATYCLKKIEELSSLERFRYHVTNILRPAVSIHRKHQIWTFNLLADHFGDAEGTERAVRTLETLLVVGSELVFDLCDKPAIDALSCTWANQDCTSGWRSPSKCDRSKNPCRLPEFFEDNKDTFLFLRDTFAACAEAERTDELNRFIGIVDEALRNPGVLRNHKVCLAFGDAIIAVQSRNCGSFLTQNIKESRVLCKAFRQLLLYLRQDLKQPVDRLDYR